MRILYGKRGGAQRAAGYRRQGTPRALASATAALTTLQEKDDVWHPLLKVWDLQKIDKKSCALPSAKLDPPTPDVDNHAGPLHLAIGLANSTSLLYQSLANGSISLTAFPKAHLVLDGMGDHWPWLPRSDAQEP